MNRNIYLLPLAFGLIASPTAFGEETIYQTGFEAPAFTPGLPIRGQDNWEMFGDGEAISVSTTNANTGDQCLRFDGSLLEPQANGSSIAVCQLSPASLTNITGGNPPLIVEIQCDVRLDGPQVGTAGTPDLDKFSANFYAVGETKNFGGFLVSSAGRIWTVSFAPGELYKYSVPYTFGTYRTLTLRADYIARTLTYLVDGVELGTSPFSPSNTDPQLTRADLSVSGPTDPIHTPEIDYDPANYTAYYDNYRISAFPIEGARTIVEQPAGTRLISGAGTVDFGSRMTGSGGVEKTFIIHNPGTADLSGVAVTIDGAHATDFTLAASPATSVPPGGSATFTVAFSPVAAGVRTSALHVASGGDPFDIAFTGTGLAPSEVAQQAYLKASNTGGPSAGEYTGDRFGSAVALSGNTLIVGAPQEDSIATGVNGNQVSNRALDSGAAYVFVHDGTSWTQQAYLKASDSRSDLWFGTSVAGSGDTVVVGALRQDRPGGTGAAYVFVRDGTNWTQQARLEASNTGPDDRFGAQLAISGDTLIVGAPNEDSNATGVNGNGANNSAVDSGAAYVFVHDGTNWTQQAYLKASNTGSGDGFGTSVAVSGDTVVVGAFNEDSNAIGVNGNQSNNSAQDSGAAYAFAREGTNWTQQAYLKASNTGTFDAFGSSVAVSGDTVLVGAPFEASNATGVNGNQANNSVPQGAGAAYVFVRDGTDWTQQAYLKASNTGIRVATSGINYGDIFGLSVSVSGDTVVVGAPYESSGARGVNGNQANSSAYEWAGAAYVFTREGTSWSQKAYLKASNPDAYDLFSTEGINGVAVSGDTLVVGAPQESSNARGVNGNQNNNNASFAGAAYVFTIPVFAPPTPHIAISRDTEGTMELTIQTQPGRSYTLQTSDDLRHWSEAQTAIATDPQLVFTASPTGAAIRFYRIMQE